MNAGSDGGALGQELSELDLSGESLEDALLELSHELEHFEEAFALDLLLHGQQHFVYGAHYVEDRVALLVDIVHLAEGLVEAAPLGQAEDGLDLLDGGRVADVQDEVLSDGLPLAGEVAGLDVVDGLAHVPVGDEEQRAEGLLCELDALAVDHALEVELHLVVAQLAEAQDDAAALDGLDDLGGGVAAEHEARGLAEVADDHAERVLRALGEAVRLVQHDDLRPPRSQRHLLLRERLDLLAHHVNAALVGGVELERGLPELPLQQLAHDAQHARRLPHPRRSRQDEVRDRALRHARAQGVYLLHVAVHLAQRLRAVLLQPDLFHGANFIICPIQTALISRSDGPLAAIRDIN